MAVGDGKDYEKYDKNPVLTAKDLPKGAIKVDFRDPKIWKGNDGNFYCVIGSRPADGSGPVSCSRRYVVHPSGLSKRWLTFFPNPTPLPRITYSLFSSISMAITPLLLSLIHI